MSDNDFNKRYLEFCKPFVDAIAEVYETMFKTKLELGKPEVKKEGTQTKSDYSAIMGITGLYEKGNDKFEFTGSLVISWTMPVYLKSASKMLMEEHTEFSEEIIDVGKEIANITMGNAKKVLNPLGYKIAMSTPTSIHGNGIEVQSEKGILTIITPLSCDLGDFFIELNYKDNNS